MAKRKRRCRPSGPALYTSPYGILPRREFRAILSEAQNHRCCYCGCRLTEAPEGRGGTKHTLPTSATVEHVEARAVKGKHDWANCVVSCFDCNNRRPHDLPAEVYFEIRVRYIAAVHKRANASRRRKWRARKKKKALAAAEKRLKGLTPTLEPAMLEAR